jgi:hypothetical protein
MVSISPETGLRFVLVPWAHALDQPRGRRVGEEFVKREGRSSSGTSVAGDLSHGRVSFADLAGREAWKEKLLGALHCAGAY